MKLYEVFLAESTNNSVEELETVLQDPHSYAAIDHMMQSIAKKYGITPTQLHDLWVEKHDVTPDEWIKSALTETPLIDIEPLGDFDKPGGFRGPVDKRIVTNPAVHARAKQFFSQSPYDFRIYPINVPGGSKFLETGQVTTAWLEQNLPVAAQKLQEVPQTDDEIVVFFTSNIGADKVPLTPWMMAHRIGHALRASRGKNPGIEYIFKEIEKELVLFSKNLLEELYGQTLPKQGSHIVTLTQPIMGALFANIGTMRSARKTQQYSRPYEFIYEMFSQYVNTGSVKFNPLPSSFGYGKPVFGRRERGARVQDPDQLDDFNSELETLGRTLDYYFGEILSQAVGNIFVM